MQVPRLVVHEPGRRWIDHIRARMGGLPVRVFHSTSPRDCLELVRGQRRTTLLVELGRKPLAALELLEQARELDRDATVLVVADSGQASLELPARELGAAEFVCQPVAPGQVADLLEQMVRSRLSDAGPHAARRELRTGGAQRDASGR